MSWGEGSIKVQPIQVSRTGERLIEIELGPGGVPSYETTVRLNLLAARRFLNELNAALTAAERCKHGSAT